MFNANPNIGVLDPFEAKNVFILLYRNLKNQEDFLQ